MKTRNSESLQAASQQISQLLQQTGAKPVEKLTLAYKHLLEVNHQLSETTFNLSKDFNQGHLTLKKISSYAQILEKLIGTLGGITLATDVKVDELSLIAQVIEKLKSTHHTHDETIAKIIHKLVAELTNAYKDKTLISCLDHLKDKAWNLLEALDSYAQAKYNQEVC